MFSHKRTEILRMLQALSNRGSEIKCLNHSFLLPCFYETEIKLLNDLFEIHFSLQNFSSIDLISVLVIFETKFIVKKCSETPN